MWTNPIDVGGTKIIGFTGTKKNTDEQSISNYNFSVVIIDSEASNSGTGGNGGNDEPEPTPEPEIDITTDTDGDKLPDVYEDMYGTDKENPDTDGDGLTDYEEITLTGTDPLVYDSVTEGVSEEDADYDDDGLTTREEITLGTDPTQADTDNDRINDYDEINVWHTDPLVADTDNTLHNLVVSNEIEMFLQAYIENDWQYFYEGHCSLFRAPIYQYSEFIALNPEAHAIYYEVGAVDQKMSKVIKRPKPTYEKDAAGLNYDYYYWDGTKMQLITTAQSFPSKW